MQGDDIIELSDSDSLKQESKEITLPATEQSKELNELRKENQLLKNERDIQKVEIARLQDELKTILLQLDDRTTKNLRLNWIKLNGSDHGLHENTDEVTRHQDDVQDMFEPDAFAPHAPLREDDHVDVKPSQPEDPGPSGPRFSVKQEPEETKDIAVVIKSEDVPDVKAHITFVKSEDGKFDIWNLEHLGLGPPVVVDERFRVGFTRAAISNVIGGSHQTTFNNWQGLNKPPYMALKRSWNPYLPLIPGDHGVAFCSSKRFNNGTLITRPIDMFVSKKANDWTYFGSYEISRCGEITPHQVHLLPPSVVQTWSDGILSTAWGRDWVKETNARLVDDAEIREGEIHLVQYTKDGLTEALEDGRLVIGFTVVKCTGYRTEWFDQFMHSAAHPKAKSQTNSKRKKASSGGTQPSAKRVKRSTKQPESDRDEDEDESSDGEYEMEAGLGSIEPAVRQSARIRESSGRTVDAPESARIRKSSSPTADASESARIHKSSSRSVGASGSGRRIFKTSSRCSVARGYEPISSIDWSIVDDSD